jgi:uncharacterized spore protein YtfJ
MGSVAIIDALRESFANHVDVKTVFGEPVEAYGKTIIPVAKVGYGFGAGAGNARGQDNSGGGGGGGVGAKPIGVIEISSLGTRFVPITDRKKLAGALMAGMFLGMVLRWLRH